MSTEAPSPPVVGQEEVRSVVSQPSSASSATMHQPPLPSLATLGADAEASSESTSSGVPQEIVVEDEEDHVGPVALSPSAEEKLEPLQIEIAGDEESSDSDAELASYRADTTSSARSRPFSPEPTAAALAKMQLKRQAFVKAEENLPEPDSSSGDQSLGSSWINRDPRNRSPQPSTSKAGDWQFMEPNEMDDHMYARDLSMRRSPIGFWDARPPSPKLLRSSPTSEMGSFEYDANTPEFTESDFLTDPAAVRARWASVQPWTTPPSTPVPVGTVLELQIKTSDEVTSSDALIPYPGYAQNVSASGSGMDPRNWMAPPRPASGVPATRPMVEFPAAYQDHGGGRASPTQKKLRRWPPQTLTSPAERAQQEMQEHLDAENMKSLVEDLEKAENLCLKGKGKKKRPWSAPAIDPKQELFTRRTDRNKGTFAGKGKKWSPKSAQQPASSAPLEVYDENQEYAGLTAAGQNARAYARGRKCRPHSPQPSLARIKPLGVYDENPEYPGLTAAAQNICGAIGKGRNWRPRSPQPSTSSAPVQPLGVYVEDLEYVGLTAAGQNISGEFSKEKRWRPRSPQPSTSSAPVQPLGEYVEELEYVGLTAAAQNICDAFAKENNWRPRSPQPSTSSAPVQPLGVYVEELEYVGLTAVAQIISGPVADECPGHAAPEPVAEENDSTPASAATVASVTGDEPVKDSGCENSENSVYSHVPHNVSGPVADEGPGSAAPEPVPEENDSTPASAATVASVTGDEPVKNSGCVNNENSVYSHVPHNISNIPQLRGLKAGRRHGRLRRLNTQNKMYEKYLPMIQYLAPMVAEEKAKHQAQQVLIASALDHFANTINQIADQYEGKTDTTGFTDRLEAFKNRMDERIKKRRQQNPNAPEAKPRRPVSPKLSEEEITRRLREEAEAAIEALMTGDRSKENPNRFEEIIKSFQAAFRPPFK